MQKFPYKYRLCDILDPRKVGQRCFNIAPFHRQNGKETQNQEFHSQTYCQEIQRDGNLLYTQNRLNRKF